MIRAIILVLFGLLPFIGLGQTTNAHSIKIQGLGLEQLIKGFLDAGFTIEKSEGSLRMIITYPKITVDQKISTQIKANINDGNILLTGEYIETGKTPNSSPITDSGTPGSPCRESWNIMYTLAQSFNKPMEIL